MTVVTMHEYVPIPEGVYNLRIESYEERESTQQKGSMYYLWTVSVLDTLPATYTGKNTFGVMTATDLTPNNSLRKFLKRVGLEQELQVGEGVDLDTFLGFVFVAKVGIKTSKNGKLSNEIAEMTVPEYNRFLAGQSAPGAATTVKAPRQVAAAPAPAVQAPAPVQAPTPVRKAPVVQAAQPLAAPAAPSPAPVAAPRPAVRPAPPAPRPAPAPVQQPVQEEVPEQPEQGPVAEDASAVDFPQ